MKSSINHNHFYRLFYLTTLTVDALNLTTTDLSSRAEKRKPSESSIDIDQNMGKKFEQL